MQNLMLEKILKICPKDKYSVVDLSEIAEENDDDKLNSLQKLSADGYIALKYADDTTACLLPLQKATDYIENKDNIQFEILKGSLKKVVFWGAFIGGIISSILVIILTAVMNYVIG